jgi:hypothetical protein
VADKTVRLLITADGRQAEKTLSGLSGTLSKFGPLAGAAMGALGLSNLAADMYSVNAETQKLQASLRTVTGSAEAANGAFSMISRFATQTPYQITDVVTAFTKLKAMGLDPSEASLRSYGNTASAMGKDLNMMIEAVADAAVGEFERLKEFGIKAKSQGDQVSFTFQGVTTTVGKNAAEIEGYLRKLGENQFAGAMTEQMNTLGGATSNLADSYDTLLRTIGDSGGNSAAIASIQFLSSEIQGLSRIIKEAKGWIEGTAEWAAALSVGDIGFLEWVQGGTDRLKELKKAQDEANVGMGWDDTGPRSHTEVPTVKTGNRSPSASSKGATATRPSSKTSTGGEFPEYNLVGSSMEYYAATVEMHQFSENEKLLATRQAAAEAVALKEETTAVLVASQLAGDAAMMASMDAMLAHAEMTEQRKRDTAQDTMSTLSSIATFIYNDSGKKNKAAFRVNQGISSANAIMNTATGATRAFAQYGWPWGAVAAAAVIAAGAVQLQQIWSANPEGGKGGSAAMPVTGAMNLTTGNGPVVQPSSGQQDNGRAITIQIQGNVIGEDKWVEENLLPAIRRASGRNVAYA